MADDKKTGAVETYDDRPIHTEPGELPPEVQAPLAPFAGAEPPSPKWFKDAIAQEPERSFVESLGTKIEALTWGQLGKPGLLLAHGNSAHADWWSFIAPYLAQDYRVTSMSLAGMGASDWRETYSFSDFGEDAEACAQATGLYEGGRKPVYVGHSFGGSQVFFAAASHPDRMHAAILVDTGFGGPPPNSPEAKRMEQIRNIPSTDRASRVYPTVEAALARFRFMPPQVAGNLYVADFIARRSLKRAPMEDGSGEGWTWRFDPNMWNKLDRSAMEAVAKGGKPKVEVPLAHIFGDRSVIISRKAEFQVASPFPDDILEIAIPDSAHHVMVDQPLALVAALRALLAVWPS